MWGSAAHDMLIKCIIRQMFMLTQMTQCEPYPVNAKILFIINFFNYQLCSVSLQNTSHAACISYLFLFIC